MSTETDLQSVMQFPGELDAEAVARMRDDFAEAMAEQAPHAPIRCFEGSAKPHEPFWRFRNATEGDEPEIELYGFISEYSWWDDDITPKMFKGDLYTHGKGGPVTVRLNSGGGDVIAASLMKSILIDYPGWVTVKIDGLAASAATIVALAGDVIMMQESAFFMIHDPMVSFLLATLNIEDMTRMLDSLKTAKSSIIDAYVTKTGMTRERLGSMMTRETWMSANEAVEFGFVDAVITAEDKKTKQTRTGAGPQNAALINALQNYRNVPEALMERLSDVQPGASRRAGNPQDEAEANNLRAKAKLLKKE